MPEMHVVARWPDDVVAVYYSPSLVIAEYLAVDTRYPLAEFVERSRTALSIASERVRAKYGFACPRAADTLARIETKAREFLALPDATVRVEAHGDADRNVIQACEGTPL